MSATHDNARIMIVDDDLITLEVIQSLLTGDGYSDFVITTRPTDALSMIAQQPPDVLLLDLLMPELSGFDVLRLLDQAGHLSGLPVIMLTAQSDSQTKLEALELGATELLSKPVDPSELRLRLRNALASRNNEPKGTTQNSAAEIERVVPAGQAVFEQELSWALRRAAYKAQSLGLMHLAFAELPKLRQSLDEATWAALLHATSERLQSVVSAQMTPEAGFQATTTRNEREEFLLLLDDLVDVEVAARLARSIINAFSESIEVAGQSFRLHVSVGVAAYPLDAERADELLTRAAAALGKAQRIPGAALRFFSNELDARSAARLAEEMELALAIVEGAFVLMYQPRLNMSTGRFTEFEALIRWQHPERGLLNPAEFIPAAEASGLMGTIEDWVLHEASRQGALWQSRYREPLRVSVNLSAKQMRRPDLVGAVSRVLNQSALDPSGLRLELAAFDVMNDPEFDLKSLDELKAMGIRMSIDHFGRGSFSLSELERLPVDEIKIDRSFFGDSASSSKDSAIVRAIISIAHDLGLRVVAVGVENQRQLEFLRAHGCDDCKGFYVSEPMSSEKISAYLQEQLAAEVVQSADVVDRLRA